MAAKLGENFQGEWDEEPFPDALWDGIEALDQDRAAGIEMMTSLAERGSALAMMYLGHALSEDGDRDDAASAEMWLTRSAEAGSIEGRYQLAWHYLTVGNRPAARAEFETLAARGYAPAMYNLGQFLFRGQLFDRDVAEAVKYLKMAAAAGHIPAMGYLSWIYRKEKFGISGRIASHWLCLTKIPAAIWYLTRYPNSDRLRGFDLPASRARQ